jgi:hypothetical protein
MTKEEEKKTEMKTEPAGNGKEIIKNTQNKKEN